MHGAVHGALDHHYAHAAPDHLCANGAPDQHYGHAALDQRFASDIAISGEHLRRPSSLRSSASSPSLSYVFGECGVCVCVVVSVVVVVCVRVCVYVCVCVVW